MAFYISYNDAWSSFMTVWIILIAFGVIGTIVFSYYMIRMCNADEKRKREYYAAQSLPVPPTTASDYNHTIQPAPVYYLYPIGNGSSPSPLPVTNAPRASVPAASPTSPWNTYQQQALYPPMPTNGSQPATQVPLAYDMPDTPAPLPPASSSTSTPIAAHPEPSPQKESH